MPVTIDLPSARALKPAGYTLATIVCSFGGFLMGNDTSIVGPVTQMENFLHQFGHLDSAVHGVLVSCVLLSAAVTSFFAGRIADTLGRTRAIALGAAIFTVGAVVQAAAAHLVMFALGRVVEGLGYGVFIGIQTVYICEISPPKRRGPLTSGPQFMTCLGLVAGYFTSYGTVNIPGSFSWRLPFIINAFIAAAYVLANFFVLPDSPPWLMLHGRQADAERAWEALGAKRDERQVDGNAPADSDNNGSSFPGEAVAAASSPAPEKDQVRFMDLWARDVRSRTFLAVFLLGFLQLCGIDAVLFASGVSAILIFTTSVPATTFADKWGRRTSTLAGGFGLTITLLLVGSLYAANAVHADHGAGRWIVIVTICLFCIIQSATWGISIKVWAPEIQPPRTRAQATNLAYVFHWVCNFFVAFVCPILLERNVPSVYFMFGGCTIAATVVSFFYMIETKGKSFSEIERAFEKKRLGTHIRLSNLAQTFRDPKVS
ncbi:hypothetical protein DL766_008867 [Monosporascus sp. MC13-8B]|uniref:Major facilitator superfamily (MFS) profile domain-containing protein n=1 Tax=Monosporascus cannonballus TaxID=155416 RepID=A0ABY0GXT7_9PEZI|nr:hypothetical protein DL762_007892 [Monosporascus cannonballus]RYO92458.1 hypothetical protein DL763_004685 [Monosporascus cannonballus]RYP17592.1 hypothetical protein DL766_008867 [Monosporascus sp. MC13-8B]